MKIFNKYKEHRAKKRQVVEMMRWARHEYKNPGDRLYIQSQISEGRFDLIFN